MTRVVQHLTRQKCVYNIFLCALSSAWCIIISSQMQHTHRAMHGQLLSLFRSQNARAQYKNAITSADQSLYLIVAA